MGKIQDFINEVYPICLKVCKEKGYTVALAQTCISQSALETGWTINSKTNAILGIKASSDWKGKVYSAKTKEVYSGVTVAITDYFRAYDSIEDSIRDYFNLIATSSRYKNALNTYNVTDCITIIKNGGYATDPDYINKVRAVWGTIQYYITSKPQTVNKDDIKPDKTAFKVVDVQTVLNVREKPTTDSNVIATLKNDTRVNGTWLYLPEYNGYINTNYVERV